MPAVRKIRIKIILVHIEQHTLEPTYSCLKASSLKADYTTGGNGQAWQDHLELAKPLYPQLDRISGVKLGDGAGWHVSLDQYIFFRFPFSF